MAPVVPAVTARSTVQRSFIWQEYRRQSGKLILFKCRLAKTKESLS